MKIPNGIIATPTAVPNAIALAEGHPTSITVKFKPNNLTILSTAGCTAPVKIETVAFKPINPIPTNKPPFNERANFTPKHNPIIVIMIGIMTVGPKLMINIIALLIPLITAIIHSPLKFFLILL